MSVPVRPEDVPVPEGYRIERFGQPGGPEARDVLELWQRNGALDRGTARERVDDVITVAIGPGDELAAVGTAQLQESRQLGIPLWNLAVFVDSDHRLSYIATVMSLHGPSHVEDRHVSGADRRAAGMVAEMQNAGLRSRRMDADWGGFVFVGTTLGGYERWVRYFPDTVAPAPPEPGTVLPRPAQATAGSADAATVRRGPVFVLAAPGSGAHALRAAFTGASELEPVDGERVLAAVAPGLAGPPSGDVRLGADDAGEGVAAKLAEAVADAAGGRRALVHGTSDVMRVPFLHAVFPGATFVYLYRDPLEAVALARAGWESGEHAVVPQPRGWDGPPWSYALIPRWRALRDADLTDVVAAQWEAVTRTVVADLQKLPPGCWSVTDHAALRTDPAGELGRLAAFTGVTLDRTRLLLPDPPRPLSGDDAEVVAERTRDTAAVARTVFAASPAAAGPAVDDAGMAALLADLHASVVVSAPDAGAVAVLRRAGERLDIQLADADRPTAIATRPGRLAIAARGVVTTYRDMPKAANHLAGPMRRDACLVPHRFDYTGHVDAAEMAWAGDELWIVATRFSCLATLDGTHSFVPRWRPPFVTELQGDDRCHLNGLCVVDGQPRYVTALGATDTPGGWRAQVDRGGVVVDVRDGRTVASGLAGPCSPRWHEGRVWVLLSRQGALVAIDPAEGTVEEVARVPGFARGLALYGSVAFVGVSATTDAQAPEPRCGVWAIDLDDGRELAHVELAGQITRLADVQILADSGFPEIVSQDSDAARNAFLVP